MKTYKLLFSIILALICSNSRGQQTQKPILSKLNDSKTRELEFKEILLDTIYSKTGYKLQLEPISEEGEKNTIFRLYSNKGLLLVLDTIFSKVQKVKFEDFNNDKVKDILIQNSSDVRSNWTYYLYLVDLKNDKVTKVKGFEEIKNPRYLPKYDLVDNLVMSGKNWTSFYKIQGDTIKDYDIVVYDEGNNKSYEKKYNRGITTILKQKNNR